MDSDARGKLNLFNQFVFTQCFINKYLYFKRVKSDREIRLGTKAKFFIVLPFLDGERKLFLSDFGDDEGRILSAERVAALGREWHRLHGRHGRLFGAFCGVWRARHEPNHKLVRDSSQRDFETRKCERNRPTPLQKAKRRGHETIQ